MNIKAHSVRTGLLFFLFLLAIGVINAQNVDLSFLRQKCPKLTQKYHDELGKYHSQYIFAVDVSGTMDKYQGAVLHALTTFFNALPNGDNVVVVPFGTYAVDLMDYAGKINAQVRQSLTSNIASLYSNPNYSADMKQCTDVEKACNMISKKINLSSAYKNNVVIILTDFRNDNGTERRLTDEQLNTMDQNFAAATQGMYTRVVALNLATPADMQKPGYCLDQLKDKVFYATANGLEIVSISNPGSQIESWFDYLKREIMVEKMRAIIVDENKMAPAELVTKVDIDGNVDAHISWTPTKLYPMMKIGKTTIGNPDFIFVDDTTLWQNTKDSVLELELGQIKHNDMGLHKLNDSLFLGIDLPTEYDDELLWLKVKKPLPNTNTMQSRWIFTFFLPFWLTVCIVLALFIYLIMVIKAIGRNKTERFTGTVDFYDSVGHDIGNTINVRVSSSSTLIIGESGNYGCDLSGAKWAIQVKKVTSSPFLVWKRPAFKWSARGGYIQSGKKRQGLLGRYGKSNTQKRADIACGEDMNKITHSVTIKIK